MEVTKPSISDVAEATQTSTSSTPTPAASSAPSDLPSPTLPSPTTSATAAPTVTTAAAAPTPNPKIWNCSACTYENEIALQSCVVCSTPRLPLSARRSNAAAAIGGGGAAAPRDDFALPDAMIQGDFRLGGGMPVSGHSPAAKRAIAGLSEAFDDATITNNNNNSNGGIGNAIGNGRVMSNSPLSNGTPTGRRAWLRRQHPEHQLEHYRGNGRCVNPQCSRLFDQGWRCSVGCPFTACESCFELHTAAANFQMGQQPTSLQQQQLMQMLAGGVQVSLLSQLLLLLLLLLLLYLPSLPFLTSPQMDSFLLVVVQCLISQSRVWCNHQAYQ
jgi:hypothetical protein